jgi:hypothetical protein
MRTAALLGTLVALAWMPMLAHAEEPNAEDPGEGHAPTATRGGWFGLTATAFIGDGLRFNNPYRLATVLGSDAQSLSRTAAYADLGATLLLGDPTTLAHGLALRMSFALEGVPQTVLTPSYLVLHRWSAWGLYGRLGPSIVLTPDTTWGGEVAAGGLWFPLAGVGLAAELVGDIFYGAGTRDVQVATYPVLSAQAGMWLSWEALP